MRQVGYAALDRDSLSNSTSLITIADGSVVRADSNKETTTLRCIEPRQWNVGLNLCSDRELARGAKSIPVRVEVTSLNPRVTVLFAGDVRLDNVGQPEMDRDGKIILSGPPIEPITDLHKKAKP